MVELTANENSDLLDVCLPLNESLFKEVFNEKLWQWYYDLGLTKSPDKRTYLYVNNKEIVFDEKIMQEALQQKNFFTKFITSVKFSYKIINTFEQFEPQKIQDVYNKETNYKEWKKEDILEEFKAMWSLLVENFKYAILANLIIQYNVTPKVNEEFLQDITTKRYNALVSLKEKNITKEQFDKEYGFYAKKDYDFSCQRYSETKTITSPTKKSEEKPGMHNLRENVKKYNIMLIAIIRKLLLALNDKDIFYKYKEEILSQKRIDITKRKKNKEISNEKKQKQLQGTKLSGEGVITGKAYIVQTEEDYEKITKEHIVITDTLDPNLVILMPIAKAIISQKGGKLSHVAIVARERNFPVMGKVNNVINSVKNNQQISLLLDEGSVILG